MEAAQRLCQQDVQLHQQVDTTTTEHVVFLLIQHDHHVTCLKAWRLITFTREPYLLTIFHTCNNTITTSPASRPGA